MHGLWIVDGGELLRAHGLALGHIEVWSAEKLVCLAETPFGRTC